MIRVMITDDSDSDASAVPLPVAAVRQAMNDSDPRALAGSIEWRDLRLSDVAARNSKTGIVVPGVARLVTPENQREPGPPTPGLAGRGAAIEQRL